MKTSHGDEDVDFSILVLGSGSWPLSAPTTGFNVPKDLFRSNERFVSYYLSKHQGRVLTWLTQLSKGELKTNFGDGKGYTFQVSMYQMGILLAYNKELSYSLKSLIEITGMNQDVLLGNLGLLCKAKLLIESEKQVYSLNTEFKSKKLRMNLNIAIKSEAKQEVDDTHKTIEKDRELVIQVLVI